jgi:hypothetical protein
MRAWYCGVARVALSENASVAAFQMFCGSVVLTIRLPHHQRNLWIGPRIFSFAFDELSEEVVPGLTPALLLEISTLRTSLEPKL